MRLTKAVALSAIGVLSLAACGGNAGAAKTSPAAAPQGTEFQQTVRTGIDPTAKGPAPAIPGVQQGGTITVLSPESPATFDPSAQYIQDVTAIEQLVIRKLTTYRVQDGNAVLVPDIAESWQESADRLSWTFKLKKGIKYEDGTEVKAADFVYGIKRSFAQEELPGGPVYQIEYLKGGGTEDGKGGVDQLYMGPYKDTSTKFEGAEAVDDYTLKINLRKPWPTLPYWATFTQASPIPANKDNKLDYGNHPLATGPYKFDKYSKGSFLTLVRNTQWDPASDPARYQNVDGFDFKFTADEEVVAKSIMASANPVDATSLSYQGVPASIYDQATGPKKNQVLSGTGPCVSLASIDTRKVTDLRVRQAIAAAWPYDGTRKAAGLTSFDIENATTYMVPTVPGFVRYEPTEFLTGGGPGNPQRAQELLKDAGAEGYELSWYFAQDNPSTVRINQARMQGYQDAGFRVKAIGKSRKELRDAKVDVNAPVNMMQGPLGWCFDWPAGDAVYPALFSSLATKQGNASGYLQDPKLDAEMERIKALPLEQQGPEWSRFDQTISRDYLPAIPIGYQKASYIFGTQVRNVVNDPNSAMPVFSALYISR